jgi:hypothetical protein
VTKSVTETRQVKWSSCPRHEGIEGGGGGGGEIEV